MTPVSRHSLRQRLHWFALHGVIRGLASFGARRGEMQGRLIADPAVRADPGAFADELRERGRIVRGRAAWLTADHALAHQLLRSDDFSVTAIGKTLPGPLGWLEQKTTVKGRLHPLLPPSMLSVEPPEHTRYRKTVSSVFTTRAVAALRERVQQAATGLLDGIAAAPSASVDAVDLYCSQLPVTVIGDILGVPDHDRPRILEFGELAAPSLDIGLSWEQYLRVESGLDGFNTWLAQHLGQLQHHPGDDLMSQIIRAGDDGARLNDDELRATAGLVLAAGFETTVNLLGNGIRILLEHPDQLALLRSSPELWPGAVEEILRLESPVQLSARIALVDTEVGGRQIAAGELVILYLAGANRDPEVFADPHRFDVTRENAGKHLSFSGGRHFCLGAALARAEGEVGLRTFFDRYPDVQLAGPGTRRDTRVLRGWSTLPIRLGEARAAVPS
ncbi:putative cytochrome P450 140 [Mycolicibacterium madagascariense]|uniref:Steroid C26-monooxygenase n=1 Tax=Mycolicibacterium madagascariense TaxID=212765 RepID=A0A7I7XAC4_9MYCO|nr:cytochrome P450 [Mycolicibacterium madagascariense]MCV7011768.1 cytochrome P450 [Mycolicibacterium madagascariense]BBZ26382.1 putative cytochrome P450 140 [Mycolicibacterium madagascariense]